MWFVFDLIRTFGRWYLYHAHKCLQSICVTIIKLPVHTYTAHLLSYCTLRLKITLTQCKREMMEKIWNFRCNECNLYYRRTACLFISTWVESLQSQQRLWYYHQKPKKKRINSMCTRVDLPPLQLCPDWKMHWTFSFSHKCWCITPLACGLWTFPDSQLSDNVSITNLIDFSFQAISIRRPVFS